MYIAPLKKFANAVVTCICKPPFKEMHVIHNDPDYCFARNESTKIHTQSIYVN